MKPSTLAIGWRFYTGGVYQKLGPLVGSAGRYKAGHRTRPDMGLRCQTSRTEEHLSCPMLLSRK